VDLGMGVKEYAIGHPILSYDYIKINADYRT
jgi:N-acetylglutamate synthase/N-acetylornithine aminotransferase